MATEKRKQGLLFHPPLHLPLPQYVLISLVQLDQLVTDLTAVFMTDVPQKFFQLLLSSSFYWRNSLGIQTYH